MAPKHSIRLSERDILFEDDNYLALNKRRGWLVHASVDPNRDNLFDAAKSFLRRRDPGIDNYLALHHRLDVWTSGVVVLTKTRAANPVLADALRHRKTQKKYRALCFGTPKQTSGEWQHYLQKQRLGGVERMVAVDRGGQKSITRFLVTRSSGELCELELELVTGRMHQLRAQTALAELPIVGDPVYGDPKRNLAAAVQGQLLHAESFSFADLLSGKRITILAPLPDELSLRQTQAAPVSTVLFHKPYGVLCQFTRNSPNEPCLSDFALPQGIYPVGRLDKDSEGLLVLTNDGALQHRLANPTDPVEKTYWAQVERIPSEVALRQLAAGLRIKNYRTRPCQVKRLASPPPVGPREPPIRVRKAVTTAWLELRITEGKNRQIRHMTAAVGHPTLRLVRVAIGPHRLGSLAPGQHQSVTS